MPGAFEATTIMSERLVLRPVRLEDADEMAVALGDPALHEFIGGQPATVEELRDRYAAWIRGSGSTDEVWLNWIVRLGADDVAIGAVQATIIDPEDTPTAAVAWTIGVPWQGHGFAGEAGVALVEWIVARGATSVVAHVHPDHRASAAVAARVGLRPTNVNVDGEVEWRLEPRLSEPS
ncbi:MAG: GNAT family N-acetyltransferase [Ilumatobacteraceae bacterium]